MKKIIIVISVFIFPFFPVKVVAENCTGATSEMFRCAQRMFEEADAKLNQVWQQLPQGTRDNLRQAQLDWIKYKEQKCRNEADMGRNGTTRPLIELGCLTGETEKRTAELEKFLEKNRLAQQVQHFWIESESKPDPILEKAILQENPEFTKSETAKKFLIGFAKESANKGIINIFKGEPSIQAVFSLDFVDKNKLAEVMQKLLAYSTTVDREDPSKNPLIGGFKDVSVDSLNMGLENLLDKSPLPGLGTVVRGTRLTATSFNIFARASDLHYSQTLGEKATITLQDSAR